MEIVLNPAQTPQREYSPADRARVRQAAQEFEGFLLGALLRSLQQTFAGDNDDAAGPGQDDYSYMGTQALASALAGAGGMGLARLVSERLVGTEDGKPR
jgi:Rod binding domain-containing protein